MPKHEKDVGSIVKVYSREGGRRLSFFGEEFKGLSNLNNDNTDQKVLDAPNLEKIKLRVDDIMEHLTKNKYKKADVPRKTLEAAFLQDVLNTYTQRHDAVRVVKTEEELASLSLNSAWLSIREKYELQGSEKEVKIVDAEKYGREVGKITKYTNISQDSLDKLAKTKPKEFISLYRLCIEGSQFRDLEEAVTNTRTSKMGIKAR